MTTTTTVPLPAQLLAQITSQNENVWGDREYTMAQALVAIFGITTTDDATGAITDELEPLALDVLPSCPHWFENDRLMFQLPDESLIAVNEKRKVTAC